MWPYTCAVPLPLEGYLLTLLFEEPLLETTSAVLFLFRASAQIPSSLKAIKLLEKI